MEFKVGDEVIIKSKEEIIYMTKSLHYIYNYVQGMEEYCNKMFIINYIDSDNYISFFNKDNKNNNYFWHHTWINNNKNLIKLFNNDLFKI